MIPQAKRAADPKPGFVGYGLTNVERRGVRDGDLSKRGVGFSGGRYNRRGLKNQGRIWMKRWPLLASVHAR